MRHSYALFLIAPNDVRFIPHETYVHLVRGDVPMPDYANQSVRVADWYINTEDQRSAREENETYSVLAFDHQGYVDWARCQLGAAANHVVYQSLLQSSRDDVDDDPQVQALRHALGADYVWLPNRKERATMCKLVIQSMR